jgi:hypothetical protein
VPQRLAPSHRLSIARAGLASEMAEIRAINASDRSRGLKTPRIAVTQGETGGAVI